MMACGGGHVDGGKSAADTDPGGPTAGTTDTDVATTAPADCPDFTYETYAKGFFDSWCAGCHSPAIPEGERQGAPVGVDFDTHAKVVAASDRILARAIGPEPTMPPVGGGAAWERDRIEAWLRCGAP